MLDERRPRGGPHGVTVYVSVFNAGLEDDPADAPRRKEFASYAAAIVRDVPSFRDVIVGNEPNLNRFWLPQFNLDRADASAPAYQRLLALRPTTRSRRRPGVPVFGGALAPRGVDQPEHRPGHASPPPRSSAIWARPTEPAAARCPIMDGFAFHPYAAQLERARRPLPSDPDRPRAHRPRDILVRLLGQAFDGTAQAGSANPDPLRRVRNRVRDPGAEARALHWASSPLRRIRSPRPPRRPHTGARSSLRTASRTWPECSSSTPTTRSTGRAGSPGSSTRTAPPRPRSSPSDRRWSRRERAPSAPARSWQRCRPPSRRPNVRSRSDASAPAPTRPDSCAFRAGRRWRRRRAVRRPGCAARSGPSCSEHARLVSAGGLVRRRGASRPARRARQHAGCRALLFAAALLGGCGGDGSDRPALLVGAVDDSVRHEGPALEQLQDAGFGAVGITSFWQPGLSAPPPEEIATLRSVIERAGDTRIFLAVNQPGSGTTPLTPEARQQFADYVTAIMRDTPEIRDVIIGNEPNLNRFWMPQFDAEGGDVAAPAYLALLIRSPTRSSAPIRSCGSGAAPWRRAGSTGRERAATPIRRRRSSGTSARPTGRAG